MQVGVILAIVFAILISIFALQNAQPVDIKFLTLEGEASLALVILISVAVGAAILGMLNLYSRLKTGKSMKKLDKEKEELKKERTQLNEKINSLQEQYDALEEQLSGQKETESALAVETPIDSPQDANSDTVDYQ